MEISQKASNRPSDQEFLQAQFTHTHTFTRLRRSYK